MKLFLLSVACLILLFSFDPSDALVLHGKHHRRNATEIREFQRIRRSRANKNHRLFFPTFPEEPLTVQLPIGTSQNEMRPYTLELSTASTEMWVLGKTYRGLTKDNNPYDPTRSTTSRWNGDFYTIEDEMEVSGNATIDVLDLSQIDSSLVFTQSFGVVNISWDYELREYDLPFPVDGVFALGWDVTDVPTKPTANSPLVHNILRKSKGIPEGAYFFTLWLENPSYRKHENSDAIYDFAVAFGDTMEEKCETPLTFFDDMTGGVIHFDSFHFGPYYKYEISGESVLVDSGSPLIYLLEAPYWVVWTAINPIYVYELGFWTVGCQKADSLPALKFSPASGKSFEVPASSYLLDVGLDDGQCVVAIDYTNYMSTNWILDTGSTEFPFDGCSGTPFIVEHCVLFDTRDNSMGFAKSKTSSLFIH